jgi:outer membrane usher protein
MGVPAAIAVAILFLALPLFGEGQRAILRLVLNAVDKGEVLVRLEEGDVWVRPTDLEKAGLSGFAGTRKSIESEEYVSLRSLASVLSYVVDEEALTLRITARPTLLPKTVLDLRAVPPQLQYVKTTSAFFNYSVTAQDLKQFSGFGEAGLTFGTDLVYTGFSRAVDGGFIRGLTNLTIDNPTRMERWVVGDTLASGDELGGSAFLGGITFERDFDLNPYFVRFPSLGLSGAVTTPSTAEIYVNGTLVRQVQLPPGAFNLSDLPVTAGSGNAQIVLKDAFGRVQSVSSPYYFATGTLAAGLSDYSYNLGFRRNNVGVESLDYGSLGFLGRDRYGFSDFVTGGARLEAARGLLSGGTTLAWKLPFGEVDLAAGASRDSGLNGGAASLGYSFLGQPVSVGIMVQTQSAHYANLSQAASVDRARYEGNAFVGVQVGSRVSLTGQYTGSEFRDQGRSYRATVACNIRVTGRSSLILSVARFLNTSGQPDTAIAANLSYFLGRYETAALSYQHDSESSSTLLDVEKSLPVGPGWGYRFQAQQGDQSQANGLVQYQTGFGEYQASLTRSGGQNSSTLTASGGLVAIGGNVFASRAVDQSYALLQVPGVGGVHGYLSNQDVGQTDSAGNLLIPNLLPYYGNRISIDDQDIPIDYGVEATEETIAPSNRAGAVVRFPVHKIQAVTGELRVAHGGGVLVPSFGQVTVSVAGTEEQSPIGREGEFYLQDVPPGTYPAKIEFRAGICKFNLEVPASGKPFLNLGTLQCKMP